MSTAWTALYFIFLCGGVEAGRLVLLETDSGADYGGEGQKGELLCFQSFDYSTVLVDNTEHGQDYNHLDDYYEEDLDKTTVFQFSTISSPVFQFSTKKVGKDYIIGGMEDYRSNEKDDLVTRRQTRPTRPVPIG